ncbi:MAG: 2-C-methyl-D-erythritol 4-phosphate cytidylyltransferase [Candidatus Hydrogenedentota bacterium]|nr:MAG: 2-C-methyl-D-erythritol 4-phosphate cytidylyltransferase [Candidatus Hydrogenedentota bacterium]
MNAAVVLLAAGNSRRFGKEKNKLLQPLGEKRVFDWTLHSLRNASNDAVILLVSSPEFREEVSWKANWTVGGTTRQESAISGVRALLPLLSEGTAILIHDAARPFVSKSLFQSLLAGLEHFDAVAPALPVVETIKEVDQDIVIRTLDRSRLRRVQTPQALRYSVAKSVYLEPPHDVYTDDLALVAAGGFRTGLVGGDIRNIKITYADDLLLAEKILKKWR